MLAFTHYIKKLSVSEYSFEVKPPLNPGYYQLMAAMCSIAAYLNMLLYVFQLCE
jgi:hypothetical protein